MIEPRARLPSLASRRRHGDLNPACPARSSMPYARLFHTTDFMEGWSEAPVASVCILFFATSGFLIASLLPHWMRRDGRIHMPRFLLPTADAIFLPHYSCVALWWAQVVSLTRGDVEQAVTYTMNQHPPRSWDLGHAWSLSVQEVESPDVWAFESSRWHERPPDGFHRDCRDRRERGPEPVAEDLRMALQELLRKAEVEGDVDFLRDGVPRAGSGS